MKTCRICTKDIKELRGKILQIMVNIVIELNDILFYSLEKKFGHQNRKLILTYHNIINHKIPLLYSLYCEPSCIIKLYLLTSKDERFFSTNFLKQILYILHYEDLSLSVSCLVCLFNSISTSYGSFDAEI